ncbi:MAG TPA: phosphopyruvate hydratase [Methanomassiliicoccales archaeon]|nr:phosphopyruvate hydratase [Methanomassiliicoccales archaeon]
MSDSKIVLVRGREVLDSRGNPTVEAEVRTSSFSARGIAPSGASTGSHEVLELRDGDKTRFGGKGVLRAVENVNVVIAKKLKGVDCTDQKAVDEAMIKLDGTSDKSRLGGNATVAVSLAVAKAGALAKGIELHEHLGERTILPVPMMNIINGGKHAGTGLKVQEFMVVPAGAKKFSDSLRMGTEVYQSLRSLLKETYGPSAINVGDEGGFAPPFNNTKQALDSIVKAISNAGYEPGKDISIAMDCAASEFCEQGVYKVDNKRLAPQELLDFYSVLKRDYPLVSIEDPVHEDDFDLMALMTMRMGKRMQLVGDDMLVTNVERIKKAIQMKAGNAVLIKVNQIGTVTEAMKAARLGLDCGFGAVVSHRSGETEDTSIADIAVALGCGQIKTGAPARAERTAKYNRLLRIEETLGEKAEFPGYSLYRKKTD